MYKTQCRRLWITFADNFLLRMFDFFGGGGQWSLTLKSTDGKKDWGADRPEKQGR